MPYHLHHSGHGMTLPMYSLHFSARHHTSVIAVYVPTLDAFYISFQSTMVSPPTKDFITEAGDIALVHWY